MKSLCLVALLLLLSTSPGPAEPASPEQAVRGLYQKIVDYESKNNEQFFNSAARLSEQKAAFLPSFYHTLCAGKELFDDGYTPWLDFNPITYRQGTPLTGFKILRSQVTGTTCEVVVETVGPSITGRGDVPETLSVFLVKRNGKWLIANLKGPGDEMTLRSRIGKILMDSRLR